MNRLSRASTPIDRTARSVVSRGSHYEPECPESKGTWFTEQPPIRQKPRNQPQFVDLTGMRFGTVRVLGYSGTKKGNGSQWVCVCACGRYTIQNGKSIRSVGSSPACSVCQKIRDRRRTNNH